MPDSKVMPMVLSAILCATLVVKVVDAAPRSAAGLQRSAATEKDSRTPAQRKIDSALLFEVYRAEGKATGKNVPPGTTSVKIDAKQRALVDVRADVAPELRKTLDSLGATIVSSSVEYRSTIAWVPLLKLERLAEEEAVVAIEPPSEAVTLRER
jgi:hypothetical protein